MSLPRELAELGEKLRKQNVDVFATAAKGQLASSALFTAMCSRLAEHRLASETDIAMLCLQALCIQSSELEPQISHAEFVATLPIGVPGLARPTHAVIRDMLRPGAKEIILLGYQITDVRFVSLIEAAARDGATIYAICDRDSGALDHFDKAWPTDVPKPKLFFDRDNTGAAPFSSMHAKCLLVDSNDLLITSANFTFHGLHGNIEIGIRLSGPPAGEARKIFSHLVENRVVVPSDSQREQAYSR